MVNCKAVYILQATINENYCKVPKYNMLNKNRAHSLALLILHLKNRINVWWKSDEDMKKDKMESLTTAISIPKSETKVNTRENFAWKNAKTKTEPWVS